MIDFTLLCQPVFLTTHTCHQFYCNLFYMTYVYNFILSL